MSWLCDSYRAAVEQARCIKWNSQGMGTWLVTSLQAPPVLLPVCAPSVADQGREAAGGQRHCFCFFLAARVWLRFLGWMSWTFLSVAHFSVLTSSEHWKAELQGRGWKPCGWQDARKESKQAWVRIQTAITEPRLLREECMDKWPTGPPLGYF